MTNQQAPEALRPIARYKIGYATDGWGMRSSTPSGIPDHAGAWVRYEDHIAALVEAQQPAPSAAAALSDDLRDRLVAISAAIADQDDRAAQAMLREILAAPQPTPTPQADSQPAPVDGANWQDISTAPKDGTRFVAVGQNYGLDSEKQHTCIAQWLAGCWVEVSDWNGASKLKYLTHWMPLPPLPGSAARAPADSVTAPAVERENLDLRRMLCVAHAGAAAYMDDGEAQDSRDLPVIDFLRDTPAEIQDKLHRRALKKLATPTPPTQTADSVLEDAAQRTNHAD